MEASWTDDELVLVIQKSDLGMVAPEVVNFVFVSAARDEQQGQQVARFLVLGLAILFKGVLQFMLD